MSRLVARAAALGLWVACCAGCSSSPGVDAGTDAIAARDTEADGVSDATATDAPPLDPPGLTWRSCYNSARCASVEVPIDYDNPDAGRLSIAIARAPARAASQRIGALIINGGGPGDEGVWQVAPAVAQLAVLMPEVVRRFDLVTFDWRGLGQGEPSLRCADDTAMDGLRALDFTPDTPAERTALDQGLATFVAGCESNAGATLLSRLDTVRAARDLDAIRAALGEERISLVTVDYGALLAASYAGLFPARVRAMVLDAAAGPFTDRRERIRAMAPSLESALDRFFAWCAGDAACALRGSATTAAQVASAFDAVLAAIESAPVPAGARALGPFDAMLGVQYALIVPDRPALARALAAARDGDGAPLLALADPMVGRREDGTYTTFLPGYYAIGAVDQPFPEGTTPDALEAFALSDVAPLAPRVGRFFTALDGAIPVRWSARRAGPGASFAAPTAPRALLTVSAHDPVGSLAQATALRDALGNGSYLVTYEGDGHSPAALSTCARDAIRAYLIDPAQPPARTSCPAE